MHDSEFERKFVAFQSDFGTGHRGHWKKTNNIPYDDLVGLKAHIKPEMNHQHSAYKDSTIPHASRRGSRESKYGADTFMLVLTLHSLQIYTQRWSHHCDIWRFYRRRHLPLSCCWFLWEFYQFLVSLLVNTRSNNRMPKASKECDKLFQSAQEKYQQPNRIFRLVRITP